TLAQPWTVMCAYNKVNGIYASEHHWLLTEVLRDEWGFDGLVMSDWGAVHDRVAIVAAVRAGELDEALLDQAVARVRRLVDRAPTDAGPDFDPDAHHALARSIATECAVLLKNHDALLPLEPAAGDTIAVVGEFARTPRYQGAGSSQVNPTRVDVALDELRAAVPEGVEVAFAAGGDEAVELATRATSVVAFL